ncbi:MAG: thioredoxin family protein [Sulfurimonas sp.]|nr:thioredoxin family protein [Sulfurimonas sp.]
MTKFLFTLMLFVSTSLFASQIQWAKDYQTGVADATKQNKPILFIYSNHNCKYCVMLEENTLKDKKVIEALSKDYISIISYSDEGDYLPRELWRPGTPTLWFLDQRGEPMFEPLMGAVDAENFLKALAIVKLEFDNANKGDK